MEIEKGYKGKKPETATKLPDAGREALVAYRNQLIEALAPVPQDLNEDR